jgi:hypothetical protein
MRGRDGAAIATDFSGGTHLLFSSETVLYFAYRRRVHRDDAPKGLPCSANETTGRGLTF